MGIDSHGHAAFQLPRGFLSGARQSVFPARTTRLAITYCPPGPTQPASLLDNALRLSPPAALRPRALRPNLLAPSEAPRPPAQRRRPATAGVPSRAPPPAAGSGGMGGVGGEAGSRLRMRPRQRGGVGCCGSPLDGDGGGEKGRGLSWCDATRGVARLGGSGASGACQTAGGRERR